MNARPVYWVIAVVALLVLGVAALSSTAGLTLAHGPDAECEEDDDRDDANASATQVDDDDDAEDDECDEADEADDDRGAREADEDDEVDEGQESYAVSGSLHKGQALLPQASISIDQAGVIAKGAAVGSVGEVSLKQSGGRLVYKVDIGRKEVKLDAKTGAILSVENED